MLLKSCCGKGVPMSTAMLNVRLDKDLKAEGERILAKHGMTVTEAVRGLYRNLADKDEVPDLCKSKDRSLSAEQKRERMRELIGIAPLAPGEDLVSLRKERLARIEL